MAWPSGHSQPIQRPHCALSREGRTKGRFWQGGDRAPSQLLLPGGAGPAVLGRESACWHLRPREVCLSCSQAWPELRRGPSLDAVAAAHSTALLILGSCFRPVPHLACGCYMWPSCAGPKAEVILTWVVGGTEPRGSQARWTTKARLPSARPREAQRVPTGAEPADRGPRCPLPPTAGLRSVWPAASFLVPSSLLPFCAHSWPLSVSSCSSAGLVVQLCPTPEACLWCVSFYSL